MKSNWKVKVARLWEAWRHYPELRNRIAAVPAGRTIFLSGAPRSGTTWLAKMLAASGIWYVHEPFSPKKGRWDRSFQFREAIKPDPKVDDFFAEVLRGGFRRALKVPYADQALMPVRWIPTPAKRMLIKDPLACLLTQYLTTRFDLQSLLLFRHPAGYVSSVHRLGWPRGAFLRHFLNDARLMDLHLAPYQHLLKRYADEDSVESAAVLHGALNKTLWDFVEAGVGKPVLFESVCRDPIAQLESLFSALGLPYDESVAAFHRQACFGESKSIADYHPHSVVRNSLDMVDGWKKQVRGDELLRIREIWRAFGVPLYSDDSEWCATS